MKKLILALFLLATPAHAQRVSDLPNAQLPLVGNELVLLVQNGTTKKTTTSALLLNSLILGITNGGTGLSTLGSIGQCLQVNSFGTGLTYGSCGSGPSPPPTGNGIITETGSQIITETGVAIVEE